MIIISPNEVVRNLNTDFSKEATTTKTVTFSAEKPTVINDNINGSSQKKRPGRPIGSSNEKKRKESQKEQSAKQDIICNYMWEVKNNNTFTFIRRIFSRMFLKKPNTGMIC